MSLLRNEFAAAIISFIALLIFGIAVPTLWVFVFSIILSFVLCDIILNFFIHGGEGWAKIFTGSEFTNKGYAYFVLLAGIVVGTILSSFGSDWILKYAQSQTTWLETLAFSDLAVILAVLFDLEWRFF